MFMYLMTQINILQRDFKFKMYAVGRDSLSSKKIKNKHENKNIIILKK
jgi:hypothetical protein